MRVNEFTCAFYIQKTIAVETYTEITLRDFFRTAMYQKQLTLSDFRERLYCASFP